MDTDPADDMAEAFEALLQFFGNMSTHEQGAGTSYRHIYQKEFEYAESTLKKYKDSVL